MGELLLLFPENGDGPLVFHGRVSFEGPSRLLQIAGEAGGVRKGGSANAAGALLVSVSGRGMGICDRPIAPRLSWQNGYVERSIRSIRREYLDYG
jgi:hypothetical protein